MLWNRLKFIDILVILFQFTYSGILNYTHQQMPYLLDFILVHSNDDVKVLHVMILNKSWLRYINNFDSTSMHIL